MRNLTYLQEKISEGKAMEAIFDACRANKDRVKTKNVSFRLMAWGGEYEATLRDETGIVVAIAIVDEFDC